VGNRPKWYLTFLAKIWKLAYIKPSVPVFGRLIYRIRVDATTPDQLNISYLPVNAALNVETLPLPVVILEGMIRRSEHRIITHRCTCRDAWKCKNYDLNIGCIHIGLPTAEEDITVAHHASMEEALAHLRKALAAGLVPFIGHVSADNTIWNVSKDRPFTTVCFCCPCCCTNFDYYRHLPPEAQACIHRLCGVTVGVDLDRCIGCGKCATICWTGAAVLRERKSRIDAEICKTCGVCAQACPQQAICVSVENIENTVNDLLGRIAGDVGGLPIASYQELKAMRETAALRHSRKDQG
jgi:Pyruvate/2-oxoacid:ferredoxin oxidoreductase delta subunit